MIVYVESNFLLEIVLGQEQATSAEALLDLAEHRGIDLVLPSFAFAEPFATVTQRERTRRKLGLDISGILRDLKRSAPYYSEAAIVESAIAGLASIAGREYAKLNDTSQRLLAAAQLRDIDSNIFAQALAYQTRFGLSPQDSIVYAVVVSDLQRRLPDPKCFITKNSRDFDDPDIVTELQRYNCRLFFSFEDGLRFCTP
jgi:predicted nucleic acid-binding protein